MFSAHASSRVPFAAAVIVVTVVLSTLLCSIWFYSSRGTNCCLELRNLIDQGAGQVCGAPPSPPPAPSPPLPPPSPGVSATALDVLSESAGCPREGSCLGFGGSCADLQDQFRTLAGCYVYGDPGAEEEHEFLDEYGMSCANDCAFKMHSCLMRTCRIQCAMPFPTTRL